MASGSDMPVTEAIDLKALRAFEALVLQAEQENLPVPKEDIPALDEGRGQTPGDR